jgi:hyaluronoglucosaminidase
MTPELGLIEGFYGAPWSFAARRKVIESLKPHGYRFYIYAPKADAFLRTRWREPHPHAAAAELRALAAHCRTIGVRFGVGLSPFELYRDFNREAQEALARKLEQFDDWGIDDLAILFDDMRGDLPDLAQMQAGILDWVKGRSRATRLIVCPSYYSDDPVLDRFFGERPRHYLEDLGRLLDPSIAVFWTGEEVCARAFSPGHLARVTEQLGRKPMLWDNYPVNDGARMSRFLHLRAFTGRPASIAPHVAAHAINPALQPTLSCIPAVTLAMAYAQGDAYQYGQAFREAARPLLGAELAEQIAKDILYLQDVALERLQPATIERLKARYAAFDHDAAREILTFLAGHYRHNDEIA